MISSIEFRPRPELDLWPRSGMGFRSGPEAFGGSGRRRQGRLHGM